MRVVGVGRRDSNVVATDSGNQNAPVGDGPPLDVRLQKVGVFLQIPRGGGVAALTGEARGAGQRGDIARQGRWGKSAVLFPSLLLGGGPVAYQKTRACPHHRIRIEIEQRADLV